MILEEIGQGDYSLNSFKSDVDYTFSDKLRYQDISIKSLNYSQRMNELNDQRKYAIQKLSGNEYGLILCEQPIIHKNDDECRLIVEVPMLQGLSALRGCMRIGIASRKKTQAYDFLLRKFKNHGCFMFSQDGMVLHDQDESQNLKRTSDFSLVQGDILHLVYDGEYKTFSIENHTANTIHTLENVNLETEKEEQQNESYHSSMKNSSKQPKERDDYNYSFISSISNEQKYPEKSTQNQQKQIDCINEEDELMDSEDTYHFAFMMGIGPSKIQIL